MPNCFAEGDELLSPACADFRRLSGDEYRRLYDAAKAAELEADLLHLAKQGWNVIEGELFTTDRDLGDEA